MEVNIYSSQLRDCDATKSCPKSVKLPKFHKPQGKLLLLLKF